MLSLFLLLLLLLLFLLLLLLFSYCLVKMPLQNETVANNC